MNFSPASMFSSMSKLTTPILCICVLFEHFLMPLETSAHEVNVHEAISGFASRASSKLKSFLEDTFGPGKGENDANTPMFPAYQGYSSEHRKRNRGRAFEWIQEGAAIEDDSTRPLNHFYDPITNSGLSDRSESPFGILPSTLASFTWASTRNVQGFRAQNQDTWQNARDYEFTALTAVSKSERDKNFAHLFSSLGHVIHLIQDLSQPAHTRNDNHYKEKHRYFENYGKAHYGSAGFPTSAIVDPLVWEGAGFTKLKDFWDRGLYTGASATPLNNDSGQQTLGLAEFSNGNFLSEDRLYQEVYPNTYSYPSLYTSTNFSALKTNPLGAAKEVLLRDGQAAVRLMLAKNADGVSVENHAALSFMGYKTIKTLGNVFQLGVSIMDERVLSDYHAILIPKAVAYSGGAIDYFFRGQLGLRIRWDEDQSQYKLQITNASTQKFKGGSFTLYSDNQNGDRSAVALNLDTPWNAGSTLDAGDSVQATFQPPTGTVAGFMLVYKGTIGIDETGSAADPVDSEIAIAAHEFKLLRFNIKWDPISDIDLYLVDPYGTVIWWTNKVSELGELDIDNIGNTGPENITLKTVIDGDYQIWVNYYEDWYLENPNSTDPDPPTPITVTMKTYFNSSTVLDTSTFTLTQRNHGEDRPIGTSGPVTQPSWQIRKLLKVLNGAVTEH